MFLLLVLESFVLISLDFCSVSHKLYSTKELLHLLQVS